MKNKLYIMVGVSGSGKSTFIDKFIQKNPDVVVHGSDKLRGILGNSEEDQTVNGLVFSTLKYNVSRDLAAGKDVMVDATSLNPKERRDYITSGRKHGAQVIAYVLERDRNTLLKNQQSRKSSGGRLVPEWVIDKMLAKYIRPNKSEGFDDVIMV